MWAAYDALPSQTLPRKLTPELAKRYAKHIAVADDDDGLLDAHITVAALGRIEGVAVPWVDSHGNWRRMCPDFVFFHGSDGDAVAAADDAAALYRSAVAGDYC